MFLSLIVQMSTMRPVRAAAKSSQDGALVELAATIGDSLSIEEHLLSALGRVGCERRIGYTLALSISGAGGR